MFAHRGLNLSFDVFCTGSRILRLCEDDELFKKTAGEVLQQFPFSFVREQGFREGIDLPRQLISVFQVPRRVSFMW